METDDEQITSLRALNLRVYLPTILFFIGDGAVLAIMALAALDLGASVAFAGFVVALRGFGVLAFDLPAGWIIARFGERSAVALATGCFVVTLVGWIVTQSVAVFAALAFVQGSGWSVWQLARVAYLSEVVPSGLRGRALSTLGGVARFGFFAGPFVAAGLTALVGFDAVYALALGTSVLAAALLFHYSSASEGRSAGGRPLSFVKIFLENSSVLFTAGVAALAIQGLRAARVTIVPLWADHIGLSVETASVLFGVSLGVELLFVYPGGSIMDRYGRKAVAVPCLVLMSLGLVLLPLVQGVWPMVLVSLLLGFGNGISSGVNATLGADLAPNVGRAEFLGIWRVFGDLGTAGGPLTIALVTATVSLGAAAIVIAGAGLLAALFVALMVTETLDR